MQRLDQVSQDVSHKKHGIPSKLSSRERASLYSKYSVRGQALQLAGTVSIILRAECSGLSMTQIIHFMLHVSKYNVVVWHESTYRKS
jgi:hypothetical protein